MSTIGVQHLSPPGLFRLDGYSQISVPPAGKRLASIAGQTALDENFQVQGETFHDQVIQAYRNIVRALDTIGARPEDVVSQTVYVVGLTDARFQEFSAALSVALDGKPFPPAAAALIGVERLALAALLVEIVTVAAID